MTVSSPARSTPPSTDQRASLTRPVSAPSSTRTDETPSAGAPPTPLSLEGTLGGGILLPGAPNTVAPVISAEFSLFLFTRFKVGLLGLFDFGGTSPILDELHFERGQLNSRSGLALPSAHVCFALPLRLCGGLVVGARIAEASAAGTYVFQGATVRRASFTVGPTVQLALTRGLLRAALDLSLLVDPLPLSFPIEALPTPLTFPIAQGLLRLSIGLGTAP